MNHLFIKLKARVLNILQTSTTKMKRGLLPWKIRVEEVIGMSPLSIVPLLLLSSSSLFSPSSLFYRSLTLSLVFLFIFPQLCKITLFSQTLACVHGHKIGLILEVIEWNGDGLMGWENDGSTVMVLRKKKLIVCENGELTLIWEIKLILVQTNYISCFCILLK